MKSVPREKQPLISKGYTIIRKIGSGGYSDVYLVRKKYTEAHYALKVVKRFVENRDKTNRIMQEISVLAMCEHENIIKLHEWFETKEEFYMVMEYIECKDLNHYFRYDTPTEKDALHIIKKIASAIKFCHDKSIIHRDIKLANVLVDNSGKIKLSDFGLCILKNKNTDTFKSVAGTPRFKAPEIVMRQEYNESIDIWSFGVLIYKLLTMKYPFDGDNEEEINKKILACNVSYNDNNLNVRQINLLKNMLTIDPKNRYTIDQVLSDPWLSGDSCPCKNCGKLHTYNKK